MRAGAPCGVAAALRRRFPPTLGLCAVKQRLAQPGAPRPRPHLERLAAVGRCAEPSRFLRLAFLFAQGIDPTVDYKKVLKAFKKEFCCNGTVVEDPEQV